MITLIVVADLYLLPFWTNVEPYCVFEECPGCQFCTVPGS